jgi:hypothetical protein
MSDLSSREKRALEKQFGMSSGYVLEFSNRTFRDFVVDSTGKGIYESKYESEGGSKASRLRAFWKVESNPVVGKLLKDLLEHSAEPDDDPDLVAECNRIVQRLSDDGEDDPRHSSVAEPTQRERPAGELKKDFFISHASEDKDQVARPLAEELRKRGYSVWIDEAELTLGDSLRAEIDKALVACRFGVLVLSTAFFKKSWPQYELDGLVAKEMQDGQKCILPVWHGVDGSTIVLYSPSLANKLGVSTRDGIAAVADAIVAAAQKTR